VWLAGTRLLSLKFDPNRGPRRNPPFSGIGYDGDQNEIADHCDALAKKGRLMFLIRAAFWLTVVVFLIPADPESGRDAPRVGAFEALGAVQATASDLSGFCARNPDVCATGSATFEILSEKVRSGVRLIQNAFDAKAADHADGTLTGDDVATPWHGVRGQGTV
jgi:hypothetical protein